MEVHLICEYKNFDKWFPIVYEWGTVIECGDTTMTRWSSFSRSLFY